MSSSALAAVVTTPRVVIVDEDRRVQQSLADLLRLTGRVSVIGAVGDVRSALEAVERERPDVVLIDPRLPDVDAGAALVTSIGHSNPSTRIVLTGWSDRLEHPALVGRGCRYVSKGGSPEDFVGAVVDACCL